MDKITMSEKERKQVKVFEQIKQGLITRREAAQKLQMSLGWVKRKYKRYYREGDLGLVHRNRNKASPRKWDARERELLISLLQGDWHGFGPTFAAEKLEELYGIKVSKESVRQVMISAGIWQAKVQRVKHRKRRERKPVRGMMVQLDGSPHDWFEGRGPACTLLVFIDDATSELLWLKFADGESVKALMQATKNYIEHCGIPHSFYVDHGSVFHVNLNNQENDKKTQWEDACQRLGIEVIHAHSPQAKGRVERSNQTMQDRLSKELRLAHICSIDEANHYLRTSDFIARHNRRFAVPAQQSGDAHLPANLYDLNDVFTIRETRILTNDFTIQYNKQLYQLLAGQKTIIRPKDHITVKIDLKEDITLWIRNTKLFFEPIVARPSKMVLPSIRPLRGYNKPGLNSRRWASGLSPIVSRVKPASPAAEVLSK